MWSRWCPANQWTDGSSTSLQLNSNSVPRVWLVFKMLSDCKVGWCTAPLLDVCVISQSGCLQTRVPLPLIKPLKQGLYPAKNSCGFVCVCVCVRAWRKRACLCVRPGRGEGRQRRGSVCTCTQAHVIYSGEKKGKEEVDEREGVGGHWQSINPNWCLLREMNMTWRGTCRWPVMLEGCWLQTG